MSERIRGKDTIVAITLEGEIMEEFEVEDFSVQLDTEVDKKNYAGKDAPDFDERYEGWSFDAKGNCSGSGKRGFLAMVDLVERRSRGKKKAQINITSVLLFPNGDVKTWVGNDARIARPRYNHTGQNHIDFSFSGNCSTAKIN